MYLYVAFFTSKLTTFSSLQITEGNNVQWTSFFYNPQANTRFEGRFVPIFYFNCEHVLFVYIGKQKFRGFSKKNRGSLKFSKSNFVRSKFLKIRSSINLYWGHARSYKKCMPDRFSWQLFWRFLDTNKQTDKQSINIPLIDNFCCIFYL